jgi:hypothetical protein
MRLWKTGVFLLPFVVRRYESFEFNISSINFTHVAISDVESETTQERSSFAGKTKLGMNMKLQKVPTLIFLLAIVLSITACSGGPTTSEGPKTIPYAIRVNFGESL